MAVNQRKSDLITRVLDKLCLPRPALTEESGGVDVEVTASRILDKAILFATLNDDPESLEDILKWAMRKKIPFSRRRQDCVGLYSPILYACLKDYTRCISILYSYGYRVILPEEEANIIQKILATNNAVENEYNLYMRLHSGDRHVGQFYQMIRKEKKLNLETDPVERLLSIKAFASPHYIATVFMQQCEHQVVEEEEFYQYDPLRKSLALARYSKFLSNLHVQYSQEYLEIGKVKSASKFALNRVLYSRGANSLRPQFWTTATL